MIKSISIVLPLFNEASRLNKTFQEVKKFIKKNKIKSKEFIFVDDGSYDNSSRMINNFIKNNKFKSSKLRFFRLNNNSGKGAALKKGVEICKNDWILTSDIDFSVSLFELDIWEKKNFIRNHYSVYFGSRAHNSSKVKSKFYRKIIGNFLRVLISLILGIRIKDTQCGFKLYKKKIAKKIFSQIKFLGYEHDIEIVLLLKKIKIKAIELPVTWKHEKLSKVNVISDSLKMFLKLFIMRIKY